MQKALIIIGFLTLSTVSLAQDDQTQAPAKSASSWATQLFNAFSVASSEIFISQQGLQDTQTSQNEASQEDQFKGSNPFSNAAKVSF